MSGSLTLECPACGHQFTIPATMAGGMTNCPDCQTIVEVPGTPDVWVFWLIVVFVMGLVTLASVGIGLAGSWPGGLALFLIAGAIVGLIIALS